MSSEALLVYIVTVLLDALAMASPSLLLRFISIEDTAFINYSVRFNGIHVSDQTNFRPKNKTFNTRRNGLH